MKQKPPQHDALNSTMEIPDGWHRLGDDDEVIAGDRYFYPTTRRWCEHRPGGTSLRTPKEFQMIYIRRLKTRPASGFQLLLRALKSLYYRVFKRYRRLELRVCTYEEASALLREQGIPGNPDEGWRIAREEDRNHVIGVVYLERRERILTQLP